MADDPLVEHLKTLLAAAEDKIAHQAAQLAEAETGCAWMAESLEELDQKLALLLDRVRGQSPSGYRTLYEGHDQA